MIKLIRIVSSDDYIKDVDKLVSSVSDVENSFIAMEECAELIIAVSKLFRGGYLKDKNKRIGSREYQTLWENLREEMADVMISIDILKQIYGISDIYLEDMIRVKMYRNIKRLEQDNESGKTV